MRIVLDTNVLVSGLLRPHSAAGAIVRMIPAGALTLCHDARILDEYRAVLMRPKFSFRAEDVDALLDEIESNGLPCAPAPLVARLPDSDDEVFLEVAVAGSAECLVTGNLRHYPAARRQGVRVLSPAEFVQSYRDRGADAG